LAIFESASIVVSGHVPITSHHVIDMLAIPGRIRTGRVAGSDTELRSRHEVCPFMNLFKLTECAREDQSTNRISIARSTMRVQLATGIASRDVE